VQSLALARDALQLEPRSADAHIAAAAARRQLGDPAGALVDLIAALRLEPQNYTAWLDTARLLETDLDDPAAASTSLCRAYVASGQRRQVLTELTPAQLDACLPLTR
jgi:tetratricopeptide (TPR) repeat protein